MYLLVVIAGIEQEYYVSSPHACEDAPLFAFKSPEHLFVRSVESLLTITDSNLADWSSHNCEFCGKDSSRLYGGHKLSELFDGPNKTSLTDITDDDIPETTDGYICSDCIYEVAQMCQKWVEEHKTITVASFI